jgi:phosphoenolpyruvate synthase/pyruvate phosphate dikinase
MADVVTATLIEWLGSAASGPETLGGKAASLDRLARMGFRIPPGFCLTTTAFERQLGHLAGGDDVAREVAETPLVPDLEEELRQAVSRLTAEAPKALTAGSEPEFAVRSSAIGEDSSAASYAGLHETELGVQPVDVDAAVRRCWASLWSPQALAYRRFRGISMDGAAMAVVVQSLVPADAAAVAFTRHPVTGRDDQLVITSIQGLGEAMVSGTVTPDTHVIDKASLQTLEFTPGDGEKALDDDELRELATLCLRVEAGFGQAVDIEAALTNGTWYLLQARPITTA